MRPHKAPGGPGRSPSSARRRCRASRCGRPRSIRLANRASSRCLPAPRHRLTVRAAPPTSACSSSSGSWRRRRAPTRAAMRCPRSKWTCASSIARSDRQPSSSTAPTAGTSSCSPRRCGAPAAAFSSTPMSRSSRRRLAELDQQRRQIMGTGERSSFQNDIIRELARNGCGQQYAQEARKRDASQNPFSLLFGGEESDGPRGPDQPVRQPAVRHLPHDLRPALRRLLLPGQLLHAAQSLPARRAAVPVAVRRPGRAVLPPEPRRRRRAGGVGQRPAALHELEVGVPLPQGIRAGMLLQAGGIQAEHGQEGRPAAGTVRPPNVRLGASKQ